MKNLSVKKLALAGMFCALCVVGSVFSFPMFGSKCAPVQHMVNVLCAVLLGPWWGVGVAFVASLLRNLLGLGSLMAFPGSMFGALLCGLAYHKTKNLIATVVGEVFGTSILGGLCAYPVAIFLMGGRAMIERQVRRDVSDLEEAKRQWGLTRNPEYLRFMTLRAEGLLEDNKILTPDSRSLLQGYAQWAHERLEREDKKQAKKARKAEIGRASCRERV